MLFSVSLSPTRVSGQQCCSCLSRDTESLEHRRAWRTFRWWPLTNVPDAVNSSTSHVEFLQALLRSHQQRKRGLCEDVVDVSALWYLTSFFLEWSMV